MTALAEVRQRNRDGASAAVEVVHPAAVSGGWALLDNGIRVTVKAPGWDPCGKAVAAVAVGFAKEVENEIAKLRGSKPFERLLELQTQKHHAEAVVADRTKEIEELRAGHDTLRSTTGTVPQISKCVADIRACQRAIGDAELELEILERDLSGETERCTPLVHEAHMALEQLLQGRVEAERAEAIREFFQVAHAALERLARVDAMESAKADLFNGIRREVFEYLAPLG